MTAQPLQALPAAPPVAVDALPAYFTRRHQWVSWRYEVDPKHAHKPKKAPYNPRSGQRARSNDSATWYTFREAVHAYRSRQHSGVAYMLNGQPEQPGDVGIDFDGCRDPATGALAPWAQPWIERLVSRGYADVSPSHTGVKIIMRGAIPKALKHPVGDHEGIEVYAWGRCFTMTGQRLPGCAGNRVRQFTHGSDRRTAGELGSQPGANKRRTAASGRGVHPVHPESTTEGTTQFTASSASECRSSLQFTISSPSSSPCQFTSSLLTRSLERVSSELESSEPGEPPQAGVTSPTAISTMPEGWKLYRCDHRGWITALGVRFLARGPSGEQTEPCDSEGEAMFWAQRLVIRRAEGDRT